MIGQNDVASERFDLDFALMTGEVSKLLGDLVEEHLDVDALLALARSGAPADLPLLPPGSAR